MSDRLNRCRYRRRNDEMCTGEVVDPDGEILLCVKHLARAMELIQQKQARTRDPDIWVTTESVKSARRLRR